MSSDNWIKSGGPHRPSVRRKFSTRGPASFAPTARRSSPKRSGVGAMADVAYCLRCGQKRAKCLCEAHDG